MKQSILLELKLFKNVASRKFEEMLKKHGLTTMQFFILEYIMENKNKNVYQKDIEKAFDIRRSTATEILQNMEKQGLIERLSVPEDARLKRIVISKEICKDIKKAKREQALLEKNLEKNISPEEEKIFVDVLRKIRVNFIEKI